MYLKLRNKKKKNILINIFAFFCIVNLNYVFAIDKKEVAPVSLSSFKINNFLCSEKYILNPGKTLFNCNGVVFFQFIKNNNEILNSTILKLGDDSISSIKEFSLIEENLIVDQEVLESILLIDTGSDLCFGTVVLGITKNGFFYNWGILDEVIEEDGDVHCSSKNTVLKLSRKEVYIVVMAPLLIPKKDGSYLKVNSDRKYIFIENGKFVKKDGFLNRKRKIENE